MEDRKGSKRTWDGIIKDRSINNLNAITAGANLMKDLVNKLLKDLDTIVTCDEMNERLACKYDVLDIENSLLQDKILSLERELAAARNELKLKNQELEQARNSSILVQDNMAKVADRLREVLGKADIGWQLTTEPLEDMRLVQTPSSPEPEIINEWI